jgi:succinoglycan biosynthesis protein ExoA
MTDKTRMTYYPRSNVTPLFKQYMAYGRGRAKNLLKHRSLPKIRQMIPLAVMPVAVFALLGFFIYHIAKLKRRIESESET